jgi:hypothetical protein
MSITLRKDQATPLTWEEMDGNFEQLDEQSFPFTGNALIDGTLSIDFTETLDFYNEEDVSVFGSKVYIDGPGWVALTGVGDYIGTRYSSVGLIGFDGLFDGAFVIGESTLPIKCKTASWKRGDSQAGIFSGERTEGPNPTLFASLDGTFQTDSDTNTERYRAEVYGINDDVAGLIIEKTNNAGKKVSLNLNNTATGFELTNNLTDDEASVFRIENNNSQSIIDLLNDNLQSDVVLGNNYADDAAAALGGVPIGGFYHTSGALKIRTT